MVAVKKQQIEKDIDRSSVQSFPASDAPAWSTAPQMSDNSASEAVAYLLKEHEIINKILQVIKQKAGNIQQNVFVDVDTLRTLIRFMREYMNDYHDKEEEKLLLPILAHNGAEAVIETFKNLHQNGPKLIERAENYINNYAANGMAGKTDLVASMQQLAEFYEGHLQEEEQHIFPLVDELLNRGAQRMLAGDLEAIPEPDLTPYQKFL